MARVYRCLCLVIALFLMALMETTMGSVNSGQDGRPGPGQSNGPVTPPNGGRGPGGGPADGRPGLSGGHGGSSGTHGGGSGSHGGGPGDGRPGPPGGQSGSSGANGGENGGRGGGQGGGQGDGQGGRGGFPGHGYGRGRPVGCQADITFNAKGIIRWPRTLANLTAERRCPFTRGDSIIARRECLSGGIWGDADTSNCVPESQVSRGNRLSHLANTTIPRGQARQIARQLRSLAREAESFDEDDVGLSVDVLGNILEDCENGTDVDMAKDVLGSVDDMMKVGRGVLKAGQKNRNAAARLIRAVEKLARLIRPRRNGMDRGNQSVTIETPNIAMAVAEVEPELFMGLKFRSSQRKSQIEDEAGDDEREKREIDMTDDDEISISLPETLFDGMEQSELKQSLLVQFISHKSNTFFEAIDESQASLVSSVIAASVGDLEVRDLSDPVEITFQHKDKSNGKGEKSCVFWDFELEDGAGGWSKEGCRVSPSRKDDSDVTVCECNHLTNFAVLEESLDSSANEKAPSVIVTVFLGISILALALIGSE
ncbi:adhesion G protein-coupled receptor A3-like [Ptychodera flava]|uniref:adhesion G protein-coupled receptor A3-like n=1 Tax=Ptychodera flava TaxID=63121 RepID=UPI00396A6B27